MKGQARASQCYHTSSSHGPAGRRLTVYQAKCDAFLPWSEFFVYRLLKSLEPHVRQVVLTRRVENADLFPMPHVEQLNIATLLSLYQSHRAACRLQSRYRGDLIHAHFGSSAVKLLLLKHLMRLPMVVTFGGKDLSVHAQREFAGPVYRYMFDAVEQIVTVSEDLRQCAIARGCPPEKVVTIRRGVDSDEFSFVDRADRDVGRIDILMVSRLVQKKGHAAALAALARLPAQAPEWRLRIIGEGPQEEHLRRQVAAAGLLDRVRFLGVQSIDRVREEMLSATILLYPSVTADDGDREGIPNVLMEGQATGLPVVATRHGGIPELVRHGETGLLAPEHDVGALSSMLLQLLESRELRLRYGHAGRETVASEFTLDRQAGLYLEIYRDLARRYPHGNAGLAKIHHKEPLTDMLFQVRREASAMGNLSLSEIFESWFNNADDESDAAGPRWYRAFWRLKRYVPQKKKLWIKSALFRPFRKSFHLTGISAKTADGEVWHFLQRHGIPDPFEPPKSLAHFREAPNDNTSADADASAVAEAAERVYVGGRKAHRAVFWFVGQRGWFMGLRVVQAMVLARLFVHNRVELGQFATIFAAVMTLDQFAQLGVKWAIIVRRGVDRRLLDVAWTLSLLRGALLYLAVFCLAGVLADYWQDPELAFLLRLVGIKLLLDGIVSPGVILLHRELRVKSLVWLRGCSRLLTTAATLAIVCVVRSALGLVIGVLFGCFLEVVVSYVVYSYRPRVRLDAGLLRSLVSFGWKVGLAGVFTILLSRGGIFFLRSVALESGRELTAQYHYASRIANLVILGLVVSSMKVFFPVFSSLQEKRRPFYEVYARNFSLLLVLVAPLAGLVIVAAPQVIAVIFGPGWEDVVAMTRVFGALIVIEAFRHVFYRMFVGLDRAGWPLVTQFITLVLFAGLLYPLWWSFGVLGVCLAGALSMPVGFVLEGWILARILGRSSFSMVRPMLGILAAAALASGTAYLLSRFLPDTGAGAWLGLGGLAVEILVAYAGLLYVFSQESFAHTLRVCSSVWNRPG